MVYGLGFIKKCYNRVFEFRVYREIPASFPKSLQPLVELFQEAGRVAGGPGITAWG